VIETPNPGSPEATAEGCICPVYDNARGLGYMGGMKDVNGDTVFVMVVGCPVHSNEIDDDASASTAIEERS
jgi:hypothetical protein